MGKARVGPMGSSGGGVEWVKLGERTVEESLNTQGGRHIYGFCDLDGYDLVMIEVIGKLSIETVTGTGVQFNVGSDHNSMLAAMVDGRNGMERMLHLKRVFQAKGFTAQGNTNYDLGSDRSSTSPDYLYFYSSGAGHNGSLSIVERVYGGKFKV